MFLPFTGSNQWVDYNKRNAEMSEDTGVVSSGTATIYSTPIVFDNSGTITLYMECSDAAQAYLTVDEVAALVDYSAIPGTEIDYDTIGASYTQSKRDLKNGSIGGKYKGNDKKYLITEDGFSALVAEQTRQQFLTDYSDVEIKTEGGNFVVTENNYMLRADEIITEETSLVNLETQTVEDDLNDVMPIYDASATELKKVSLSDLGALYSAYTKSCKVVLTSNQSIPNSTLTAISWTSADYDNDLAAFFSGGSPTRVTPHLFYTYYLIDAQITFEGHATPSGFRAAKIRHNGATDYVLNFSNSLSADKNTVLNLKSIVRINTSEYIEIFVMQTQGASLNVVGDATKTYLSIHPLALPWS